MSARSFHAGPETAVPVFTAIFVFILTAVIFTLGIFVSVIAAVVFPFAIYLSVPFLYAAIPSLQRTIIFMNKARWNNLKDHFNPNSHELDGGRNFYITSEEGIKIGVWHLLPSCLAKDSVGKPVTFWTDSLISNVNPIVIYFHGNQGSRASGHRAELYQLLQDMNYHVIAIDYRGYGDSTSVPKLTETGLVKDASATFDWVVNNSGKGVPIYIWGHSLGTGVTTHTAALISKGNQQERLSGIIQESAFTNMREAAMNTGLSKIYKYFPGAKKLFTSSFTRIDTEFKSDEYILQIDCPILMLHADDDMVVPVKLGRKLYEVGHENRKNQDKNSIHFLNFRKVSFWAAHAFICRVSSLPDIIRKFTQNPKLLNSNDVVIETGLN